MKSYDEVVNYAEKVLGPRFRQYFERHGGAPARFSEVESMWPNEQHQSDRYFEDRTPITHWKFQGKEYEFSGTEINQEQPNNLGSELRHLIIYKKQNPELREAQSKSKNELPSR